MLNVGNDVVDLKEEANRGKSRDSRFLKKIFTDAEIEYIKCAHNPDRELWSIWVCKETAYKVIKKTSPDAAFTPRRWQTILKKNQSAYSEGDVIIPNTGSVYVRLFFTPEYVHCVGVNHFTGIGKLIWKVESLPQERGTNPSVFLRGRLEKKLAQNLSLHAHQIKIERIKMCGELQPPCVYIDNKKTAIDVSMSHDGRFVAYAFFRTSHS